MMTFNIRLNNPSDGKNAWTERQHDVIHLLTYYHPDVFGVQEALPEQMLGLQQGLKGYDHIGVGREDGKNKGEFSAVFYNKNVLKLLKSGNFWLSETPEIPGKGWDAACERICTYALFQDLKTKKMFWTFNTHLDHVGKIARDKGSKLIVSKIAELNRSHLPVVLMGDFNGTESSDPYKNVIGSFVDSFYTSSSPHYGPLGTFTDFKTEEVPQNRIDYIFTKGFSIQSHRHINDRRENLLYYSDHFPVLVSMEIK